MTKSQQDVHLSEIQFQVMHALWAAGKATTSEVYERVGRPRSLAYTTIATLLTRLEKRQLIRSVKEQNERIFQPLVSESEVTRSMVTSLVATLFRGDSSALVSHLVKDGEFTQEDLQTVRKLLAKKAK